MSDICNTFCSTTKKQRDTILLLEALALIHDIGKLSDRFLESEEPEKNIDYGYSLFVDPSQLQLYQNLLEDQNKTTTVNERLGINKHTFCAFSERPDLTENLNSIEITDWSNTSYTLAELVPFLSKTKLWEKTDWHVLFGKSMQPGLLIGYMHGIAHFDKEDNTQAKQPYKDVYRATPFGFEELISQGDTSSILSKLPIAELSKITTSERHSWLCAMRDGMKNGIADNRRPINDVTLWDWGYLVASLTKAASNYIFASKEWPKSLTEIEFIILRINIDKLEAYASSDKISDLLGKQETLDEAYTSVKKLLEETFALGNRIYHDETGDYYLMPNIFSSVQATKLRKAVQKEFPNDLRPRVLFGKPVTAGELDNKQTRADAIRQLIAEPRIEAKKERAVQTDNDPYLFENEWGDNRPDNSEICSVCGKYPVGYPAVASSPDEENELAKWATREKAEARNVCRFCLRRRGRRAEEWEDKIHKNQPCTTIWTDEVADDNGRLTLFIGTFGLEKWLDGSMLETTRLSKKFAKNPSPARLFRITETVRSFWDTVSEKIVPENLETKTYRLQLTPDNQERLDLGNFHTYELEYSNATLATVWRKPCNGKPGYFLTTENLDSLARKSGIILGDLPTIKKLTTLFSGNCSVKIPSSYGKAGFTKHTISCHVVPSMARYVPAIPFLAEPGLCMILLPADKSLQFIIAVKAFYEKQMNKVQDRLPLGIGLVFFPSRTPMRAVMEAGKSMHGMLEKMQLEEWIMAIKPSMKDIDEYQKLEFTNGRTLKFKRKNGLNPKITDDWYLWHFVSRQVKPLSISELRRRDMFKISPSRFDFEFLDTAGRRYEICYDEKGKRGASRPFYLADFDRLEQLWKLFEHLSLSQRYQIIGLIETKREEWKISSSTSGEEQQIFSQFIADTLAGANWPKEKKWYTIGKNDRDNLVEAATNGQLKDWAELHMQILKEKNGGCE